MAADEACPTSDADGAAGVGWVMSIESAVQHGERIVKYCSSDHIGKNS
jgi:hypothetical protein